MQALFPDSFVQAVSRLRIVTRRASADTEHGEHVSRRAGAGIEFRDYRSYVPGDDLRRVDWNVYRRTRRLFLRLAEEPRELPVHILLDASTSMFFETPPRVDAGRQAAAALVAAAMHQHDPVTMYAVGDDLGRPMRPTRGLAPLLAELAELQPRGGTSLARVLRQFAATRPAAGLVAIISDFFDPQGLEPVLDAMAGLRQRLVIVQLARQADREPQLDGDLHLLDCETNVAVRTSVTEQELKRYRAAYNAFEARLNEFATGRGAAFIKLDCDRPVLPELSRLFVGGVLRV